MRMKHVQRVILGNTKVAAPLSKTAPRPANAVAFFRVSKKNQLLPLNAADCAFSNIRMKKEGEHHNKSQPPKRSITCPLKRGRSIHRPRLRKPPVSSRTVGFPESGWRP
jgi:hypothetical protein